MIIAQQIQKWFMEGKLDRNLQTTATHKQHKHFHNPTFKSINHAGVSPTTYRHDHLVMRHGRLYKKGKKAVKK